MAILNNSPVLPLSDIIIQLLNNELLSDISFNCDNKVIYAHSFLLMSRSVVYEKELHANQGVIKLIPIQNYDYETFYQFVRFIYTDACTITKQNMVALLELSVKYKIPKLENMVIAFIMRDGQLTFMEKFHVYEFCANESYELLRNWISPFIFPLIQDIIKSEHFVETQPHILESILKMDYMGTAAKPVKEVDLFKALLKWMDYYCTKNDLALSERREKFDWLIKLIRFPNMINYEFMDCAQQSNNLFTDSDFLLFFKPEPGVAYTFQPRQFFNAEFKKPSTESVSNIELINGKWSVPKIEPPKSGLFGVGSTMDNSFSFQPALLSNKQVVSSAPQSFGMSFGCSTPQSTLSSQQNSLFGTTTSPNTKRIHTFETTENLVISGLRIKSSNINSIHVKSGLSELLNMQLNPSSPSEIIVSLGESYMLCTGNKHQIEIKTSNPSTSSAITDTKIDLVNEKFIKCYKESVRDDQLIEIFFKMPIDE